MLKCQDSFKNGIPMLEIFNRESLGTVTVRFYIVEMF